MISFFENLLKGKSEESKSEILYAHWCYDKKVLPTALQSISNLFPHYSLHDETHSITILNNIVRLLGKEQIQNFTSIDIWLLLEAAYLHDIGMVVPSDMINDKINKEEFLYYFKGLMSDRSNSLYDFANKFSIKEKEIHINEDVFSLEIMDGMKFIIADYFRKFHGDLSKEFVKNPHQISLNSPRGIIPDRIFKLLGDICACHTKSFNEVMKLPFSEVGIQVEDAHPRLIACLLRIGDLLDLDNNRFSDVMLRTLSKIPINTLMHKSKHLSIESFQIDKQINISAKCKTYEVADITQHWFNYIDSEISQQLKNWNKIAPNKDYGMLPTVGELKVELEGYEYIDGTNKPVFTIDTEKVFKLLIGTSLYKRVYESLREILQNAVDATLIRIWLENKDKKDIFSSPHNNKFLDLLKSYPIEINVKKEKEKKDKPSWIIEIKDNGIGISKNDLKYLTNTASSSKNKFKSKIVEDMPLWLQPSGFFGIGFQSIFMLTNEVIIKTKNFFNEKPQIIELNSPNSSSNGAIRIKKVEETNYAERPGSKICFKLKEEGTSIISYHFGSFVYQTIQNFDPFSGESLDIRAAAIIDEIYKFNKKTIIPINFNLNEENLISTSKKGIKKFDYFDTTNFLEVSLSQENTTHTYYKGQPIENSIRFPFINFEININKEKADEVLKINREKLNPSFQDKLTGQVLNSLKKYIPSEFNNLFKTTDEKAIGSMFLKKYFSNDNSLDLSRFNHWENYIMNFQGTKHRKKTFKELLTSIDKLRIVEPQKLRNKIKNNSHRINDKLLTIELDYGIGDILKLFIFELTKPFFHFGKITKENECTIYEFYRHQPKNFNFKDMYFNVFDKLMFSSRLTIPCSPQYEKLQLKQNANKYRVQKYRFNSYLDFDYPKMLSPYKRNKKDVNKNLIKWVYENRYDESVTIQEIKEKYDEFCNEYDEMVKEVSSKYSKEIRF